jgi:hypothetical protein
MQKGQGKGFEIRRENVLYKVDKEFLEEIS